MKNTGGEEESNVPLIHRPWRYWHLRGTWWFWAARRTDWPWRRRGRAVWKSGSGGLWSAGASVSSGARSAWRRRRIPVWRLLCSPAGVGSVVGRWGGTERTPGRRWTSCTAMSTAPSGMPSHRLRIRSPGKGSEKCPSCTTILCMHSPHRNRAARRWTTA